MTAHLDGDSVRLSTQNFPRDVYNVKVPQQNFFFAVRFFLRQIYAQVVSENPQLMELDLT